MANKQTIDDLKYLQALPLDLKISITKQRLREWVNHWGLDGVYVAFSGGKDSSVLLSIARQMYPCEYDADGNYIDGTGIKAIFVDTGLEYPEIRDYVKSFENVDWLRPKMNFKQVIEKYGYPFIGKEVSNSIFEARNTIEKYKKENNIESSNVDALNQMELKDMTIRVAQVVGRSDEWKNEVRNKGIDNPKRSIYDKTKWQFLLDAPFLVGSSCCRVMKKEPSHRYGKTTGRVAITGQMAEESKLRTSQWIQHSCNYYDGINPISNPMSFWTEQDVYLYIKKTKLKICSVYGDIVVDDAPEVDGQVTLTDYLDDYREGDRLKTTGCSRTGCMFCGYGCYLEREGEGRFEMMKETHPKQYEWIMKDCEEGGLGYKKVIDWLNENGNLHIRY